MKKETKKGKFVATMALTAALASGTSGCVCAPGHGPFRGIRPVVIPVPWLIPIIISDSNNTKTPEKPNNPENSVS